MYSPKAAQFERYVAANLAVYDILVTPARKWVRKRGTRELGTKALFERARWELSFETYDAEFLLTTLGTVVREVDRDSRSRSARCFRAATSRDDGPSNIAGQRLKRPSHQRLRHLRKTVSLVASSKAPIAWLQRFLS